MISPFAMTAEKPILNKQQEEIKILQTGDHHRNKTDVKITRDSNKWYERLSYSIQFDQNQNPWIIEGDTLSDAVILSFQNVFLGYRCSDLLVYFILKLNKVLTLQHGYQISTSS